MTNNNLNQTENNLQLNNKLEKDNLLGMNLKGKTIISHENNFN